MLAAAAPQVPVRAFPVSGDGQLVQAYAAPAAAAYITEFPRPLVVRVDGPAVPKDHPRHVVFTCVTKGCVFAGAEQHEDSDWVNRAKDADDKEIGNAYDVRVHDGRAAVYVALQASGPRGAYVVRALPVANRGERATPTWFRLRTR